MKNAILGALLLIPLRTAAQDVPPSVPPRSRGAIGLRIGPAFGLFTARENDNYHTFLSKGYPGWDASLRLTTPAFHQVGGLELSFNVQQSTFTTTQTFRSPPYQFRRHRWLLGTVALGGFMQLTPRIQATANLGLIVAWRSWVAEEGKPLQLSGAAKRPFAIPLRAGLRFNLTPHWQLDGYYTISGWEASFDRNDQMDGRYWSGSIGLGYQF